MKYSEILSKNSDLKRKLQAVNPFSIKLLSNIIVSQLKDICEYYLREQHVNAAVTLGDYDNIIQDSTECDNENAVIIFWEFCNIIDGFQYKCESSEPDIIEGLMNQLENELLLVFKNLEKCKLVIFNMFSSLIFTSSSVTELIADKLVVRLNNFIHKHKPANFVFVDVNKVLSTISIEKAVDFRNYYSSKSLYTIDFFKTYISYVKPIIFSLVGKSKKAIIFDCDNTLWKGIVGEDGIDGIKLAASSKSGAPFEEVQHMTKALVKRGIILGLCSKNNPEEVENVLRNHKDMVLKESDIVIKKINWKDKATNLSEISSELNIGLDSLVFYDDSDFEVSLIKERLPSIETIKVPALTFKYPEEFRKNLNLFYTVSHSEEDSKRVNMYKDEELRKNEKQLFSNLDDYLKSLNLQIHLSDNNKTEVPRLAQLTQKTNQFNLTTKRYTESEIHDFIKSAEFTVRSFSVEDKFGDYGITGLAIIKYLEKEQKKVAFVDSFLMSCRVIGRNIERKFWDELVQLFEQEGISVIESTYIPTLKNKQTENFYEELGFQLLPGSTTNKIYKLNLKDHKKSDINYIKVNYGRKD